ncbi:hypothetical protein ACRARG_10425 [Pseudooceanicola sp. C21-150M6]|uniref:hypothetical protein n=1 Tax=Pseudooceanicola sp. C21-150M6 TaxID=3434355 RepID=UPI003D7FE4E3
MKNWFKAFIWSPGPETPGDPFAHPDIARMSARELADLPLVAPPAPSSRKQKISALRATRTATC